MPKNPYADMVIVIDTREQDQFFKRPPKGLMVVRDKLDAGDYSIRGFENEICIERKNPDDFLTSITSDSTRFKKRLAEMENHRAIVVVECELSKLLAKCDPEGKAKKVVPTAKGLRAVNSDTRNIHPNVVKGAVRSIMLRYGVQIYFAINRRDGEEFTLNALKKFYQMKRDGEL